MKNNTGVQQPMTSSPVTETFVLVAEVTGDNSLIGKLGQVEADRAVERCRTRAERAIEAYQGSTILSAGRRLVAYFQRCDNAALAAQDLRDRVSQLPPVSGVLLSVRVGVHMATNFDAEQPPSKNPAVEFASHLISAASPGQILLSREAAMQLSENIRGQLDTDTQVSMSLSSNGNDTPVYELRAGSAGLREITHPPSFATQTDVEGITRETNTAMDQHAAMQHAAESQRSRLMLRYQGSSFIVSESHPVLLAGREEGNDLVVLDRRSSRQHSRIEWRHGRYMLIDSSTNGTYLVDDGGVEIILRRSECELPLRGRIGFGFSPLDVDGESAAFDIGQR